MKRSCIILSILSIVLFQSISYAQIGIQRKLFSSTFSSAIEYQSWKKSIGEETESISQINFPTTFKMPITRNVAFDLISSAIFSSRRQEDKSSIYNELTSSEDNSLSGLRDVKVRGVAMLEDDTIMLTIGLNLPSGRGELNSDEMLISSSLSDRAMGFKYSRLGEGFDINLGYGFVMAYRSFAFGVGIGYLIKGEYSYIEDKDSKYNPGNQLNITAGFDLLAKPLFLRTDLTYTIYNSDEVNGLELFKEGEKLAIEETAVLSMERFSVLLSGRYTIRGKSRLFYMSSDGISEKIDGNQISINGMVNLRMTDQLNLKLLGKSLFIDENDKGKNDATVFGFGAGVTLKFMRQFILDITGKYHFGNSDGDSVDLKGISMTTALKMAF